MHPAIIGAGMLLRRVRHFRPVEHLARRPGDAQRDVLLQMLRANSDTRFGVEHGFGAINDYAQFRARVPVQDYETLRPYVDEQRKTGSPALTKEPPMFYAQTSGTTGRPKLIPVTPSMLTLQRAEQGLFSYLQYRAKPAAFAGRALAIIGAAVEGHLDSGQPFGSVSGYLYYSLPWVVRSRFVLPPEVSAITDYDLKYFVILRLALAERQITYLGSPNPSTFLRLLDMLQSRREELLRSLETGHLEALDQLDASTRRVVRMRLRKDPPRARELDRQPALTFATLWPGIRLVTTWTGGSCGVALNALRKKLPPAAAVMEIGYQSSECRGTIALEAESPGGLPPLHHHFFEFVDPVSWEAGTPEFLTLDRLELGRRYYVLLTTVAGLYRYFMNDVVEVTGFFHRTPLIRFVQKGRGVTSLTGEKLYEAQVIEAVHAVAGRDGLITSFFLLVADDDPAGYRLYLEWDDNVRPDARRFAVAVDAHLGELNVEYHGKRASGCLAMLQVAWLTHGTAQAYKAACVQAGQREGQFKPPVVLYRKDLALEIDDHVIR